MIYKVLSLWSLLHDRKVLYYCDLGHLLKMSTEGEHEGYDGSNLTSTYMGTGK
jgi:hypothetical protein